MVAQDKTDLPLIAAIGNFDGVHRGHQFLLTKTAEFAVEHGARVGAVVFTPHPRRYFDPECAAFNLTTPARRDALLRTYGVDEVLELAFDKNLATLAPEAFVREILKGKLNLAGVVAGADFRFGAGRAGDGDVLTSIGADAGLHVKIVDILAENPEAEKFGSSGVRNALRDGDVKLAAEMLGRPWSVSGAVEEGQKLGRTLGFPTANMVLGDLVEPRKGVYAVHVRLGEEQFDGVANFGRRPTVGVGDPLLEAHLFDFDGDLYGKTLEVSFVDFIRDEQKFDGLDALKAAIANDCDTARRILS